MHLLQEETYEEKRLKLKLFAVLFSYDIIVSKVIIEKSCGEVSLMGQNTIENVS